MSNLRPLQLGEILDGTFSIYGRHFALFMRLSMVVVWLPTAIWVYFQVRYGGLRAPDLFAAFEQHTATAVLTLLVLLVISTAASLMLKAGTIQIISDSYLGRAPQLGSALRLGADRIIPLLVVVFSKVLLIFVVYLVGGIAVVVLVFLGKLGGTALAVLFGLLGAIGLCWALVYIACGYGLTTPVVVLEDLPSSFDAFRRSWDLTRTFRMKVLGVSAVTWLIAYFLPQLVVGAIGVLILAASPALQPFLVVIASLLGILLSPIMPCAATLLYYDLRVRREAFDLEMLSQQLGTR